LSNSIWIYRLYDVAEEIKLDAVEKILSHNRQTSRMRLSRIRPKSIQFKNPPVAVELGEHPVSAGARQFQASFTARVYDLGVISIIMRIPAAPVMMRSGAWPWSFTTRTKSSPTACSGWMKSEKRWPAP